MRNLETKSSDSCRKARYEVCAGCAIRTDVKQLYYVRSKMICVACGEREIREWNSIVRESEAM